MLKQLSPVLLRSVTMRGGFWGERLEVNRTRTIPHIYQQLEETGRLAAWSLTWHKGMPNRPHVFWDSDVAKWIEAAAYSLMNHPDVTLEAQIDLIVTAMSRAQASDGYLNSYFLCIEPDKRWTNERDCHELYCAGHLIEAAVAYFQATGKRHFLEVVCRYADHIDQVFGPGEKQKHGYPGHEEIELALVKLYDATGEGRYLNLAKYFIDERGKEPNFFKLEAAARGEDPEICYSSFFNHNFGSYAYHQAHLPLRQQTEVTGHAVRAMYLYSGAVDVASETEDLILFETCCGLWRNLTERRIYITGGIGPTGSNEGFSVDYDLPNETAYAETCASIGLVLWAHRMLQVDPRAWYADVIEQALYNGVLSGVSLDGEHFFYDNPLAFHPAAVANHPEDRRGQRVPFFSCACCPPNVARVLASLGTYLYSASPEALYVHLYAPSVVEVKVGGATLRLEQATDYPWSGQVDFTVHLAGPTGSLFAELAGGLVNERRTGRKSARFTLALRLPGWCRAASLAINGEGYELSGIVKGGYACIDREWKDGDRVALALSMPVERVEANLKVRMDCGRVALQRGPVVYCLESADNGPELNALRLPADALLSVSRGPKALGNIPVITGTIMRLDQANWEGRLYRPAPRLIEKAVRFTAIPYALWANRDPGEMLVWLRT